MTTIEKVSRVKEHTVYRVADGTRVPGVTTVLGVLAKPALIAWANQMGLQGIDTRKYVDRLAEIGTLAHYWIECILRKVEPDLSTWSKEQVDLAQNSVLKFLAWMDGHEIEVVGTELQLVSEQYCYGGTVDVVARVDGELEVVDIKTAKAIYEDMMYQVAAYWQLARENGQAVDAIRIVQAGRTADEGFTVRHASGDELARYWRVFQCALDLYRALQEKDGTAHQKKLIFGG